MYVTGARAGTRERNAAIQNPGVAPPPMPAATTSLPSASCAGFWILSALAHQALIRVEMGSGRVAPKPPLGGRFNGSRRKTRH
jgi:hypothetical protein